MTEVAALSRAHIDGTSIEHLWLPSGIGELGHTVAVNATHVYWGQVGEGILRAPIAGGVVERPWLATVSEIVAVRVDAEYVYWADGTKLTIGRAKLDGSEVEPEWVKLTGFPRDLAIGPEYLYILENSKGLGRVKLDSTGLQEQWPNEPAESLVPGKAMTLTGEYLYLTGTEEITRFNINTRVTNYVWMEYPPEYPGGFGIATDGTYLYVVLEGEKGHNWHRPIARINIATKTYEPTTFIGPEEGPFIYGVTVDAGYIYWTAEVEEEEGIVAVGKATGAILLAGTATGTAAEPERKPLPAPTTNYRGSPFTYLARDLLTWEPLDTLPYTSVSFGRALDQHGSWKGSLPLAKMYDATTGTYLFDWKDATRPSRTALFVDLEGTLVWGGIIWKPSYDSSDPTDSLQISATEFGSYFQHRLQAEDYGTIWEAGEDPMKVAKRVIENALEQEAAEGVFSADPNYGHVTGSKIPVVLNPAAGSGQSVVVSYPGTSLQTIESIVSTLTQMGYGTGFDVSYDVAYLPGTKVPAVTINLWWPLKGRNAAETGIVVLGRDTVKWTYPEDGEQQGTEVVETGGSGTTAETGESKPAGYPLLQKVQARSQITTNEQLAEIAIGDLALYEYPSVTPSIILPVGLPASERATLRLGEFDVGDRMIFRIDPVTPNGFGVAGENTSPRFPEGMEHEWRIAAWTCVPKDTGLSTVQLDLGVAPLMATNPPPPPH